MKKLPLITGLAFSLLASASVLAAEKTLRIGIEAAYPPFASKTDKGEIVGFDYDIGNALCAQMKVKCVWVEGEFDGLIPSLKVKKIDMALSSMTSHRGVRTQGHQRQALQQQRRNLHGPGGGAP